MYRYTKYMHASLVCVVVVGVCSAQAAAWSDVPAEVNDQRTNTTEMRGNWWYKKIILTNARPLYEQVRAHKEASEQLQVTLLAQRSELDQAVESFFSELGVNTQELTEAITAVKSSLEKTQAQLTQLEDERASASRDTAKNPESVLERVQNIEAEIATVQAEEKRLADIDTALQAFQERLEYIRRIDDSISKAFGILIDQVGVVRSLEAAAWSLYDRIAYTVDDAIAARYFREIQAAVRNSMAIEQYIRGDLSRFFASQSALITQEMQQARTDVTSLRQAGLFVVESHMSAEQAPEQAEQTVEPTRVSEPVGWWRTLVDTLSSWWTRFVDAIYWVIGSSRPKKARRDMQVPQVDTTDIVSSEIPQSGEEETRSVSLPQPPTMETLPSANVMPMQSEPVSVAIED